VTNYIPFADIVADLISSANEKSPAKYFWNHLKLMTKDSTLAPFRTGKFLNETTYHIFQNLLSLRLSTTPFTSLRDKIGEQF
jgi:hypothetical protein